MRECLPEDAGSYTCLAENSAGRTSCRASVAIRGEIVTEQSSNKSLEQIYTFSLNQEVQIQHS